jgi:nucleoside triphosphate diphosphatase
MNDPVAPKRKIAAQEVDDPVHSRPSVPSTAGSAYLAPTVSDAAIASAARFAELVTVMARLRDPESGCPWDLEQSFETVAPYTLEEAYEVAEAVRKGNRDELKDELGDLLLQVVFHAQMAQDEASFTIDDVIAAIVDKMVRRHPHVFGSASVADADAQTRAWEAQKADERRAKARDEGRTVSALDGVALALPALQRAEKLQKRAARVGFDWPTPEAVLEKIDEEVAEVRDALASGDVDHTREEIGDVLFVMANLARKCGIDPEAALRQANTKFERRFHAMEALAQQGQAAFEALSLAEQEALWIEVKRAELSE